MSVHRRLFTFTMVFATAAVLGCDDQTNLTEPDGEAPGIFSKGPPEGKGPKEEVAGNNLSYPVIWADGVTKVLPGAPGMTPVLGGEWWYQWGTNGIDPDIVPASCTPDPDEANPLLNPLGFPLCDDGVAGSVDLEELLAGYPPADNPLPLAKAYLQKDPLNTWQAGSADWSAAPVNVDWIDWGDNLESVDWYTRSQVRTEVVLFQDLDEPMLEYQMRHTDGWGIDEVHGLAVDLGDPPAALPGPGTRATVYSHCARLTIQLLLVSRDDPQLADLEWEPEIGWTEPAEDPQNPGFPYPDDLINPHIFNGSVHEGGDGPGYYSAEINVKGRIIYGYTWNVRQLHDPTLDVSGAGDYRVTFSFDQGGEDGSCPVALNTLFVDGTTDILVPLEEVTAAIAEEEGEEPGGGAVGVLNTDLNLTYMDIRILERGGGGGGGKTK